MVSYLPTIFMWQSQILHLSSPVVTDETRITEVWRALFSF